MRDVTALQALLDQAEVDAAVRAAVGPARADIRVTVADGIAHLRGQVDRSSTARAADRAARDVPGVVDVQDDLMAEVDDLDVVTAFAGA